MAGGPSHSHSNVLKRVFRDFGVRSARSSSIGSDPQSNRSADGGLKLSSSQVVKDSKEGRRTKLFSNRQFRGFGFSLLKKILFGAELSLRSIVSMMQPNGNAGHGAQSRAKGAEKDTKAATSFNSSRTNFPSEAEMRKVFERLDENNDGAISTDELRRYVENLGFDMSPEEVQSLLKTVDENGDGTLNFDEFYAIYPRPCTESDEQSQNDKAQEDDLKSAFRVYDKDGDGYIDAMELRSVLMSLKIKEGASLTKCQEMIKRVDVDGNGKVDFKEFKKMMSPDGF